MVRSGRPPSMTGTRSGATLARWPTGRRLHRSRRRWGPSCSPWRPSWPCARPTVRPVWPSTPCRSASDRCSCPPGWRTPTRRSCGGTNIGRKLAGGRRRRRGGRRQRLPGDVAPQLGIGHRRDPRMAPGAGAISRPPSPRRARHVPPADPGSATSRRATSASGRPRSGTPTTPSTTASSRPCDTPGSSRWKCCTPITRVGSGRSVGSHSRRSTRVGGCARSSGTGTSTAPIPGISARARELRGRRRGVRPLHGPVLAPARAAARRSRRRSRRAAGARRRLRAGRADAPSSSRGSGRAAGRRRRPVGAVRRGGARAPPGRRRAARRRRGAAVRRRRVRRRARAARRALHGRPGRGACARWRA